MSDLIDTTEMYLRTIYELIEDGVTPMRARIAEQLGHTGPTVSQTIARMERDGLVVVSGDRHLELTAEGLAIATRVMRKHRLAERLLTDVIGLELPFVHEEACRWEHVMSDRVERRLIEMLEDPERSPYGNPIPGLEELGLAPATPDAREISARDATNLGVTRVMLTRIGENPQTLDGFLELASEIGLLPGVKLELDASGETVTLATGSGAVTIPADSARHVFVVRMPDSA
jgi:DtxR family Mn-dependent transcriptional regulator